MSESLTFAVVSDIHYGSRNNLKETTDRLRTFILWLKKNEEEIDSVIVLGDTVHNVSKSQKYNEELFKSVYNMFEKLDITVSFLAGDQDVNALGRKDMEHYIGATYGVRGKFIGIDTSWENQNGPQGKVDNKMFRKYDVPKNGYVFSHHPLVPWDIEDNQWFSGSPELAYSIDKEPVWENIIKNIEPKIVINGHIREQKSGLFDGIPCYSVNPFNREFYSSTVPSGYFYTVTDDGESITVKEHVAQKSEVIEAVKTDIFDS